LFLKAVAALKVACVLGLKAGRSGWSFDRVFKSQIKRQQQQTTSKAKTGAAAKPRLFALKKQIHHAR